MNRRLYFLFPDEAHLRQALTDLSTLELPEDAIHVAGEAVPDDLPKATWKQRSDYGERIAHYAWHINMAIFWIAAAIALWGAFYGAYAASLIGLLIMLSTYLLGNAWTKVPHTHATDFTGALSHHEMLLMVDVEREQVATIEHLIHRNHPEAVLGGVSWQSKLLHT